MSSAKSRWDNSHYRQFAASLEEIIDGHRESGGADAIAQQRRQVESLCDLEQQFRNELIRDKRGANVYKAFVKFVRDERRNILAARPYFRERQDVFKSRIAPALRDRADKSLYQFGINYPFIAFAIRVGKFPPNSKVGKLATKVKEARQELIEMNVPFAISRARAFLRHKQAHLELMDLVQIGTEGLIAAIDKFVPPYNDSFGGVLYGRITGDLVEGNSETLVHFYPSDKRKIYTANKLVKEGRTFEEIAHHINSEAAKDSTSYRGPVTDANEIQQLHVAAYTVSGDSPGESDDSIIGTDESPIHRFEADETWRPDVRFEQTQLMAELNKSILELSVFERKLLALKGINL